jgi:hypothetical protein
VVDQVSEGYPHGLDDYLNDLDGRQLLEEALGYASDSRRTRIEKRVRAADERMKALVKPSTGCLWGQKVARAEGWTPVENWWYFSVPRQPGPLLEGDLDQP